MNKNLTLWLIASLSTLVFGCSFPDYVESNKRVNFDACKDQCLASKTTMGVFEQGLGYVRCSCLPGLEKCETLSVDAGVK